MTSTLGSDGGSAAGAAVFSTSIEQSARTADRRANRGGNRRDHGADHTDRQRELRDRPSLLFHQHPAHVPFVDQASDLRQD